MSFPGNRLAGFPGLNQALADGEGENLSAGRIENVNLSVISDGDTERILYIRPGFKAQFAKAVAIGKKNENAGADWISHVDRSAVVQRDRLRMIHPVFLEREKRLSFIGEFGDEGTAGVDKEHIAQSISSDSGGLAQLTRPIPFYAPLTNELQRRRRRRWAFRK